MSFVIMLLQCRVYLPSELLLTAHHWAINVFLIVLLKSVEIVYLVLMWLILLKVDLIATKNCIKVEIFSV